MRGAHVLLLAAALLALVLRASPAAHEIPRHVTVQAFVKPEGGRLRLLIRVPLAAMRDMQFPQDDDGFLDTSRAEGVLREAVSQWVLPELAMLENGAPLPSPTIVAVRPSLPSDRSFGSYDAALAHVTGGSLAADVRLPWAQAQLDVLLEYPIRSDRSDFAIRPGFGRLGVEVVTALRFVTADRIRAFELHGDPGLVRLDPRLHEAAWRFVKIGFLHILDGVDHLLFLLCLVIPFRRLRPLIVVVTAFTAAHSIALFAAAWNLVPDASWFPSLVETLIAGSVLYMALENIVVASTPSRRALLAFGFGIVHGFGFSFALKDTLQFAGSHLVASLFAFNVGVEIGQVVVLAALVPAVQLLFRFGVRERIGTIVLSALVAHVAWHWTADRWNALRQFPAPAVDAAALLTTVRLLFVVVVVSAGIWLGRRLLARAGRPEPLPVRHPDEARNH